MVRPTIRLPLYVAGVAVVVAFVRLVLRLPLAHAQLAMLTTPAASLPDDPFAVVILGYTCHHGRGEASPALMTRLRHAAKLCRDGGAACRGLVPSGGIDPAHDTGLPTEADIMATALEAMDVAVPVMREGASGSTRENAQFSLRLLRKQLPEVRHVVVVTNGYHTSRALQTFRRLNTDEFASWYVVGMAPVPLQDDEGTTQKAFCRELLAWALYWARGWL